MAKNSLDADSIKIEGDRPISLTELHEQHTQPIEIATESVLHGDALALERFLEEPVKIIVHETADEGELQVISVIVNGVNHPVRRGVETTVKRKFVEALAHAKTTKFRQVANPVDPSDIQMIPTTALAYPFSVTEDSPKGKSWLKEMLAQPA